MGKKPNAISCEEDEYAYNIRNSKKREKRKFSGNDEFLTETDWKKKKGNNRRNNQYKDKQKYNSDYEDENWN